MLCTIVFFVFAQSISADFAIVFLYNASGRKGEKADAEIVCCEEEMCCILNCDTVEEVLVKGSCADSDHRVELHFIILQNIFIVLFVHCSSGIFIVINSLTHREVMLFILGCSYYKSFLSL